MVDITVYTHLPLTVWWPWGKSMRSHTFLSWRDLISSLMAVIQGSWSFFLILRTSLKYLGSEPNISTAMDRWCHIHCWLYIAPILFSSLVGVRAGCSTVIGSSWIGTSPYSRLHSMWMEGLSPYMLLGNTLDMGMQADHHWTGGQNMDHSSIVGWCWWECPQNSDRDSLAFCFSGS